jgi:hypothetical protein
MLGHASAAMTLDVYAGLFNPDLDDVADRLDEAARAAGGVSQVCPNGGSEGIDEGADGGQDDGDDGLGGVGSCGLTWVNNGFRLPGQPLLKWSIPPE